MNIDLVHNGISQLVLVVSATLVGTFHSPIPIDSPQQQSPVVIETQTYAPHEVVPTPVIVNKNIVGVGKGYNNFVPTVSPTISNKLLSKNIPTPTSVPSALPTATATSIPQPSPTITPTLEKKKEVAINLPESQPMAPMSSLNADTILQIINKHREELQLPAFIKDEQLCKIAEYRKPQLYDEIFTTGNIHKGFYDLNLPYYITENMAHYGSEQAIVNWWLGSAIHKAAIESNSKYSCGACAGNSCAQLFTNYVPKS